MLPRRRRVRRRRSKNGVCDVGHLDEWIQRIDGDDERSVQSPVPVRLVANGAEQAIDHFTPLGPAGEQAHRVFRAVAAGDGLHHEVHAVQVAPEDQGVVFEAVAPLLQLGAKTGGGNGLFRRAGDVTRSVQPAPKVPSKRLCS